MLGLRQADRSRFLSFLLHALARYAIYWSLNTMLPFLSQRHGHEVQLLVPIRPGDFFIPDINQAGWLDWPLIWIGSFT
jgi:hypothetical protein